MPRAEIGSTKYLANRMKSVGLQRLRWFCQVCEKQCRDQNAFKQHTMSESHMRQMLVVGAQPRKVIEDYSKDFQRDFLQLLRTSHGTKSINANHFYQEYISNKTHVHMNATRWASLTEFVKFLGRESICRVTEGERGLEIAWIDNSPEALRRQDHLRKKERMEKGDEEREQRMIQEQVDRARRDAEEREEDELGEEAKELRREEGTKLTLDFGKKKTSKPEEEDPATAEQATLPPPHQAITDNELGTSEPPSEELERQPILESTTATTPPPLDTAPESQDKPDTNPKPTISLSLNSGTSKPKNVFATMAKKNALNGSKPTPKTAQQRPMSEAERIMREEMERKRKREAGGFVGGVKNQRV